MENFDMIITFLSSSVTGVVTFLLGLKKGKAETEGMLLENLEKSISIYQVIINDMREEIKALNTKIDELEKKVESLLFENTELKEMMKKHDASTNTKK